MRFGREGLCAKRVEGRALTGFYLIRLSVGRRRIREALLFLF